MKNQVIWYGMTQLEVEIPEKKKKKKIPDVH